MYEKKPMAERLRAIPYVTSSFNINSTPTHFENNFPADYTH
jgi:hypothetical protein